VRRLRSIGVLLSVITGLLAVMLVSVFAYQALDAWRREQQARTVLSDVNNIRQILGTAAQMRLELGQFNLKLDAPAASNEAVFARLKRMHNVTQRAIAIAIAEAAHSDLPDSKSTAVALGVTNGALLALYPRCLAMMRLPRERRDPHVFAQWRDITTLLTRQLSGEAQLLEQEATGTSPFIDATLRISDAAWALRQEAGRERSFIQTAVIDNKVPSLASLEYMAQLKGMALAHWSTVEALAQRSTMPAPIKQAVARAKDVYIAHQVALRDHLLDTLTQGHKLAMTGDQWIELSDHGLSAILAIANTALSLCGERARALAADAQRSFIDAIALMLLSLALASGAVVVIAWRVIRPIKAITGSLNDRGDAAVPCEDRQDEIGAFARALKAFRAGAAERERLKSEILEQRSAKEAADAANRIKSSFLANMSHELRTPLNAILGFSEVLQSELFGPLGHERYKEYADYVHKSGAHLLDLINDVLDMSKIDAGRMELKESIFSVTDLVDEAVMMVKDKARGHCDLVVQTAARLPAIGADKRLIKQVLLNLLSNAIKFTPDGGKVTVTAEEDGEGIVLKVTDTGIGMDEQELATAFSPYGQVDSKIARTHQGTGLGLPISRSLAELHGGTLTGESRKGAGTTLILRLPASRIRPAADVA